MTPHKVDRGGSTPSSCGVLAHAVVGLGTVAGRQQVYRYLMQEVCHTLLSSITAAIAISDSKLTKVVDKSMVICVLHFASDHKLKRLLRRKHALAQLCMVARHMLDCLLHLRVNIQSCAPLELQRLYCCKSKCPCRRTGVVHSQAAAGQLQTLLCSLMLKK